MSCSTLKTPAVVSDAVVSSQNVALRVLYASGAQGRAIERAGSRGYGDGNIEAEETLRIEGVFSKRFYSSIDPIEEL